MRVNYKLAKLAYKKGFREPCIEVINELEQIDRAIDFIGEVYFSQDDVEDFWSKGGRGYLRPTQSELLTWLRDKHKIFVGISPTIHCNWIYRTIDIQCDPQNEIVRTIDSKYSALEYNTPEECLNLGIEKALNYL